MDRKKYREKKTKSEKRREPEEPELLEKIPFEDTYTKDFGFLVDAPVSEDDHFVFRHEKEWTVDVSKYSDFFTADLRTLSAAIESFPFNELVEIDSKYFTSDQLTNIYNNAERGKEAYERLVESKMKTVEEKEVKEVKEEVEEVAEDLDFLLSLEEPVSATPIRTRPVAAAFGSETKATEKTSGKPTDLEKWLDSILDD